MMYGDDGTNIDGNITNDITPQSCQANKLSKEISLDDSKLSKSLDSQTLENFKQNNCWTEG